MAEFNDKYANGNNIQNLKTVLGFILTHAPSFFDERVFLFQRMYLRDFKNIKNIFPEF